MTLYGWFICFGHSKWQPNFIILLIIIPEPEVVDNHPHLSLSLSFFIYVYKHINLAFNCCLIQFCSNNNDQFTYHVCFSVLVNSQSRFPLVQGHFLTIRYIEQQETIGEDVVGGWSVIWCWWWCHLFVGGCGGVANVIKGCERLKGCQ